jgi:hypothetical protein
VKQFISRPLVVISLIAVWLSHLLQVFVPETGFDALWYHLPVVKEIVKNRGLIYLPDLYQSVNPLFTDLHFALGFWLAGDFGAKVVAYLFGLSLIYITYKFSRKFLNISLSLFLVLLVSTFQAVAWQSASFYIDLAKASFELASLYFLYKFLFEKESQRSANLIGAGLFFGASLASKLFSLFLSPVYLLLVVLFSQKNKVGRAFVFFFTSLLLPLPFYLFSYLKTGYFFYSFHLNKLAEIGGSESNSIYLWQRLIRLAHSPFELFLAKDYISFIFIIFLPVMIFSYKKVFEKRNLFLLIFALSQYLLWWFLPPASTRYAISGFIALTLLYFNVLSSFTKKHTQYYWPIIFTIMLSVLINFAPRIIVNLRSLEYLIGGQTKQEYLEQFLDGWIDEPLQEWHFYSKL